MSSGKRLLFERALAVLDLLPDRDYHVLDFGCGKGEFLDMLSRVIGKNSRLVGYDAIAAAIADATARYPGLDFICEKFVNTLPFPDASFDIFVTMDTIECVKNKTAMVEEIHRVLRPGGKVLATHWDWDTQLYNIQTVTLARKAAWAFSDWKQPWMDEADGQMGRKLWGLFESGNKFQGRLDSFCLIETEYEAGMYGFDRAEDLSLLVEQGGFDKDCYARFRRELSESSARGEYLYSVLSFIYCGERSESR